MIDRHIFIAVLVGAILAPPATAADAPETVVAAIYKRLVAGYEKTGSHRDEAAFTWGTRKNRHLYYSASLAKAWDRADAITAPGDQSPPASDPITNSQDPLVRSYDVTVARRDAKTATLLVHIADKPGPITPTDQGTIYYDMVLEAGRWRIDDIRPGVGKDAWSLRKEIINHKG